MVDLQMAQSRDQQDRGSWRLHREDGRLLRRSRLRPVRAATFDHVVDMVRTFPLGRLIRDAPLRLKAFAASAVLLICLIALGGHAYLTAEKSAADLIAL